MTTKAMKWVIWTLAVIFYLYELFLRFSPSVMVPELSEAFHVSAAQIGALSAFYLYAYAPLQIPVGVLMDKFGPRRLLTLASAICGLGGILFGFAPSLWVAEVARVFMGIGSAFAWVGMVSITSQWFPPKHMAALIAVGHSIGMLGGVGGEGPLGWVVEVIGWRGTSLLLGVMGAVLAMIIYFVVRNAPQQGYHHDPDQEILQTSWKETFINLWIVIRRPSIWMNGLSAMFFYATSSSFAALWAVPFLVEAYDVTKVVAGFAVSSFFLGWIVGGPLIGYLSDQIHRRKGIVLVTTLLAAVAFSPVVYSNYLTFGWVHVLLFVTGLLSAGQLLSFSMAIVFSPGRARGSATAFTNFIIMIGGSIIQPLVGVVLDRYWDGTLQGSVAVYSIQAYRHALMIFPASFVLAFLCILFVREPKRPRPIPFDQSPVTHV